MGLWCCLATGTVTVRSTNMSRAVFLSCLVLCLAVGCYAPFPRNDPRSFFNPIIVPWWCEVPKIAREVLHVVFAQSPLNEPGKCSNAIPEPEPESRAEPRAEPGAEPRAQRRAGRRYGKRAASSLFFNSEDSEPEPQPESDVPETEE